MTISRPAVVDTRGWEDMTPEDTFDGDYGRLLDRVYGKGVASPTGFDRMDYAPVGGQLRAA
jgi:hypothetical protein